MFSQAAEQGDVMAQYNLGVMYYEGTGIKIDRKKAKEWLRKAAAQGHQEAQAALDSIPPER